MDTITTFVIGFFILIFIANLIWPGHKRLTKEDKELYDAKIPTTEKWAKILRIDTHLIKVMSPIVYRLKLSDGREFEKRITAFDFDFVQVRDNVPDKKSYATLNSSGLKIGDTTYKFNIEETKGNFNYNGSLYNISLEEGLKKDNEDFAQIIQVTANYTEILFKNPVLGPEELFAVSAITLFKENLFTRIG